MNIFNSCIKFGSGGYGVNFPRRKYKLEYVGECKIKIQNKNSLTLYLENSSACLGPDNPAVSDCDIVGN